MPSECESLRLDVERGSNVAAERDKWAQRERCELTCALPLHYTAANALCDASIDEPIRRVLGDRAVRFEIDTARSSITRGSDGLQANTE